MPPFLTQTCPISYVSTPLFDLFHRAPAAARPLLDQIATAGHFSLISLLLASLVRPTEAVATRIAQASTTLPDPNPHPTPSPAVFSAQASLSRPSRTLIREPLPTVSSQASYAPPNTLERLEILGVR